MTKQLFWTLFKYGLGIGLLASVIWLNREGLASAFDRPVNVQPLLLASVICLGSVLLTFVRWHILVRAQGLPFTLPDALRLGLIGYTMSTFLPGSVGGDIIKAAYIAREQSRRTVAVATVLLDRAIGLIGLFWLVALVGGFFWAGGFLETIAINASATHMLQVIVLVTLGFAGASLAFWLLLGVLSDDRAERLAGRLNRIPRLGHALAEFWRAVWMYRRRGRSIGLALLLAIIGHIGFVLTFYFASLTLNQAEEVPTLGAHFLLVPAGMSAQALPISFGGLGVGEAAFGQLYQGVGFASDKGVLGCLIQRVITWGLAFAGYLVYLRMRPALAEATQKDATPAVESPPEFCLAGNTSSCEDLASSGPMIGRD